MKTLFIAAVGAAAILAGCQSCEGESGGIAPECGAGGIAPARIGVCSWSWRLPMREVATAMDQAGVTGVQLALGPFLSPDKYHGGAEDAAALAFVKEKVAKGEWRLMSTMVAFIGEDYTTLETIRRTGGIVPDRHWAANRKLFTAGCRLTQELGCRYLTAHAGFLDESDPKALATFVSRVTWLRDEARKYGVTLILESGQETAEDLASFMGRVPGVGINFDPANLILYGKGDPRAAIRILYPWIRQVHVKDARTAKTPGTWGDEVVWGTGEVGGSEFIAELERLGYRGNYVVEREEGENRAADIASAVRALTRGQTELSHENRQKKETSHDNR